MKASISPLGDQAGGAPALSTFSRMATTTGGGSVGMTWGSPVAGDAGDESGLLPGSNVLLSVDRGPGPFDPRARSTTAITSWPPPRPTSARALPLGLSARLRARTLAGRLTRVRTTPSSTEQPAAFAGQAWPTSVW